MSRLPAPGSALAHGAIRASTPAGLLPNAVRAAAGETFAVAAATFVWLAATAWARPLLLPDEGRYVGVAWEMLRPGDWLTPTLNGLPFFHKPPLFYWITAASMGLLGRSEWAARAAPIAGAWLGAFALYLFTRRWAGPRAARLTVLALLAQPLFFIGGQFANLDMLVAGFITVTVLLLAHAALSIERGLPYRRSLRAAYAVAALGVLTKGLIGIVIPALVMLAWLALMHRRRELIALVTLRGAALFMVLAAPWFIAMQWMHPDFLHFFFVVQHFKRFAAGGFNNVQPFWFYPAVLSLFSLPWLPWLRRMFTRGCLTDPERGAVRLMMWLWIVVVQLFFSMPKSKLIGYVMPAVPPLAFLLADGLLTLGPPSARAWRLWRASAAASAAVSVGVVAALSLQPRHSSREIALALGAQRGPHEPVFMLQHYYYDVPFYATIDGPVAVVDDWSNADVSKQDNWRKELADAARFAAPARSASTLIGPAALSTAVCLSSTSWVIGPTAASAAFSFLAQATPTFSHGETTLWRLDASLPGVQSALGCTGPAA